MSSIRQLGLIHILLAILLPIALSFFFMGCQGDEGQAVDYGPQTTTDKINQELNVALANVDPTKLQIGQYVDKIQSQTIAGQVYNMTGEVGQTVVDRQEDDTQVEYKIVEIDADYVHSKKISIELTRNAAKAGGAPAKTTQDVNSILQMKQIKTPLEVLTHFAMDVAAATDPAPATVQQTYHNLVVEDQVIDPPADVVSQPNCGGLSPCKIKIHKVTFDLLVWNDPANPDKIHRVFQISGDTPFLSNLMSECDTLLVPLTLGKTIVTLCEDVSNFKFAN